MLHNFLVAMLGLLLPEVWVSTRKDEVIANPNQHVYRATEGTQERA